MELTISLSILKDRGDRHESLWYASRKHEPRIYWATAPENNHDSFLAYPHDLLFLAFDEGQRVLHVHGLGWNASDYWAARIWLDTSFDLIIVEGLVHPPHVRLFGPLHHDVLRRQTGNVGQSDSLAYLPHGVWHWVPIEHPAQFATCWTGAMGIMSTRIPTTKEIPSWT